MDTGSYLKIMQELICKLFRIFYDWQKVHKPRMILLRELDNLIRSINIVIQIY
jgi:hypothetical protein